MTANRAHHKIMQAADREDKRLRREAAKRSKIEAVLSILRELGWQPFGSTMTGRVRYQRQDGLCCSVGALTTCFYRIEKLEEPLRMTGKHKGEFITHDVQGGRSFSSADLDAIRSFAEVSQ